MKTLHLSLRAMIVTVFVLGVLAIVITTQVKQAEGGAFTGSAATQYIATTTTIGPTGKGTTIFNVSKSCTARTIATSDGTGVGIRFLTGDPSNTDLASTTFAVATGNRGLTQAGSTTVTYDGGLNGCGRWTAWANTTTTLTVVEYQ